MSRLRVPRRRGRPRTRLDAVLADKANRLKQWRGTTRYEKTATVYLVGLHVAGIFLWPAR
nr:hypothetical protein [Streptomyces cavernae]